MVEFQQFDIYIQLLINYLLSYNKNYLRSLQKVSIFENYVVRGKSLWDVRIINHD